MKQDITQEEIELIKNAQAGSETAFSRLFHKYKDFVDKLLYTYIKDMDEAKDITNIVFLRVHEKLSQFTDYSTFGGWLRILTKNVAIDYLRTVKLNYSLQDEITVKLDEVDTEQSYMNKLTYDNIVALFDKLPPSYRDTCKLFYVDNIAIADISKMLDMPRGTIKSNLHRSRIIIKNYLTKSTDAEPSTTDCGLSSDYASCSL